MPDDIKLKTFYQERARKGGKGRMASTTPEQRSAQSKKAGSSPRLPRATHSGTLQIGDISLSVAVLEGGVRVITQRAMGRALGKRTGGPTKLPGGVPLLPSFLAYESLKPFITNDITVFCTPIIFRLPSGNRAHGFKAELLPKVCEIYLKAREAGVLPFNQQKTALACEMLVRALAQVGIVALVDEASGFPRELQELRQLLNKYISEDLQQWTKRFPDKFFLNLKRLYGLHHFEKLPPYAGHFINKYIYGKLAPGLLEELKRLNPKESNGRRHGCYHQWLSTDVGHPALEKQLIKVTTLLGVSDNKQTFETFYDRIESTEADATDA